MLQRRRTLWLSLLIVVLCGIWGSRTLWRAPQGLQADIAAGDPVDAVLIVAGLESKPRFADTLSWWTGPWVAGPEVAFYRPLTSTLWWIEYKVFGRQGLHAFQRVHAVSHLIVLAVALLFLNELLGLKVATLAVCFYALGAAAFLGLPTPEAALERWKDDPDLWCSTAYLASLWLFVKFLRTNRRQWLFGSMAGFVLALTFKEMAYTLPLMLPLLLWYERKLQSHWRSVIPFWVLAACALAFRYWALQGFGFRFGTNGSWFDRWFINVVGGFPASLLSRGDGLPLALACFALGACALAWRTHKYLPLFSFAVGLMCYLATELCYSVTFGDATLRLLILFPLWANPPWVSAIPTALVLFLWWRFLQNRSATQILGYSWIIITYIPLMTAPITPHALYFVAIGWSIWLACATLDLVPALGDRVPIGVRRASSPVPSPHPSLLQ